METGIVFASFLSKGTYTFVFSRGIKEDLQKGTDMKKALVILLVICCSTAAYSSSVSVLMTAPEIATTNSITMSSADVSALLTAIYGGFPQVLGKGGVDYTMNALSASYQQGTYSGSAYMESENVGKGLRTDGEDSSPSPVPEPNTLFLVGIGLAVIGFVLRLRR